MVFSVLHQPSSSHWHWGFCNPNYIAIATVKMPCLTNDGLGLHSDAIWCLSRAMAIGNLPAVICFRIFPAWYSKAYIVTFISEFLQTFISPQISNSLPQVSTLLECSSLPSQWVCVCASANNRCNPLIHPGRSELYFFFRIDEITHANLLSLRDKQ